ncbi:hypothetical protein [Peribacillus simplex]|uniref:Phosphatidylserine/phosphatidylglycerophosphate/ cardiolipin synthase-like protein n=1 Tax=Peribacillus simplex TaxID=1478 RepID=A0AAN2PBK8_9BACI|nr:hypothetical protein [Peribacillus simplex]CEG24549.1 phosphatidylserine/phosphatidylglycerophosphate/ cardiolipin synthase-like protein [Peribacillus simplex]
MTEEEFLFSLKQYLQHDNKLDLLQLLASSEITFNKTSSFTTKSWQCKEYVDIRVPIPLKKEVLRYESYLRDVCAEIYIETPEYDFYGINIKALPYKSTKNELNNSEKKIINPNIIYDNFYNKVAPLEFDEIEKTYILEACLCAKNGNMLAAATMLGCAAERLLLLLSEAYLDFLKSGEESTKEIANFEKNVVNADKAHKRLDGLYRYTQNKEKVFEGLGFEKSNLHFAFLDFIRQVRNDSGHPTGNYVLDLDLNTIFSQYQLLYEKLHHLIEQLKNYPKVS